MVLGDYEIGDKNGEQLIKIESKIVHVDYNRTNPEAGFDIALIRLAKAAVLSGLVRGS